MGSAAQDLSEHPERGYGYRLDAGDVIVHVDELWAEFARENGAPNLPSQAVGTSVWSYMQDETVQEIYRQLFRKVRRDEREVSFTYRCDSPDERRLFRMTIAPLPNFELDVRSALLQAERRPPVRLLDPATPRTGEQLRCCSFCRRVQLGEWLEVEEATRRTKMLEEEALPELVETACPSCLRQRMAVMERL